MKSFEKKSQKFAKIENKKLALSLQMLVEIDGFINVLFEYEKKRGAADCWEQYKIKYQKQIKELSKTIYSDIAFVIDTEII